MSRGWASAWATASLVISWNRTRRTLPPLPSWLATCQAMASPSRSGSVADALGFRTRFLGATATAVSVASAATASVFTLRFLAATHQSFVKRRECASLPSRTRLRKPDDLDHRLLCRLTIGVDVCMRVAIERLALLLQLAHPSDRVLT